MSIDWHSQYPKSWSLPEKLNTPKGYSLPAQMYLTSLGDNYSIEDLNSLASQILDDPLSVQQFTQRVYELMQQDVVRQNDRFNSRKDLL